MIKSYVVSAGSMREARRIRYEGRVTDQSRMTCREDVKVTFRMKNANEPIWSLISIQR